MKEICTDTSVKILGQIVLYNPEMDRLIQNIYAIVLQVDYLYLFDNGSENISEVEQFLSTFEFKERIYLYKSGKNNGIARALNAGMKYALKNGYAWILTLDQDSVFPENGIQIYKKYMKKASDVAIFTPYIYDRNLKVENKTLKKFEYIDKAITSGALTNVEILKKLNGYEEWLFIDKVDYEFSWRVINAGYKIMQINEVNLLHELANCQFHYFFNHKFIVYNYSPFRLYYQVRNQLYLDYKYGKKYLQLRNIRRQCHLIVIILFYEQDKKNKIKAVLKGGRDAYKLLKKLK